MTKDIVEVYFERKMTIVEKYKLVIIREIMRIPESVLTSPDWYGTERSARLAREEVKANITVRLSGNPSHR